jgi:uncharacterized membrane protein
LNTKWGRIDALITLFGVFSIIIAGMYYDELPEQLAIHFNFRGEPDGHQSKFWTFVIFGFLIVATPLFLKRIRHIQPNMQGKSFEVIRIFITLALIAVFASVIAYNL